MVDKSKRCWNGFCTVTALLMFGSEDIFLLRIKKDKGRKSQEFMFLRMYHIKSKKFRMAGMYKDTYQDKKDSSWAILYVKL